MKFSFVRLHIVVVLAVTLMVTLLVLLREHLLLFAADYGGTQKGLPNFPNTAGIESQRPPFRLDYRYEKEFGSFYKLHESASPWPEARVRCQAEGARLMVPKSLDEAEVLPLLTSTILNKYKGAFIGLHDLFSENFFVTEQGYLIHYTMLELLWEPREPAPGVGRCVAVRHNGRLFVHPCNESLPYICKVKETKYSYYNECDTYNPNWKRRPNSSSCYLEHTEAQPWEIAYATCLSAGGYLAVLDDREEAKYVNNLLRGIFDRSPNQRVPVKDFAYIGFSDHFQLHHFRTVHGVRIKDMGFREWQQKPVMVSNCGEKTQNETWTKSRYSCGGIRRTGMLDTIDCDIPAIFFCEKNVALNVIAGNVTAGNVTSVNGTLLRRNQVLVSQPRHRRFEMKINYGRDG